MASTKSPDVRTLAQRYTRRALRTLATIMEQGASEQARIAAADKLLDRAHGKPKAESEMPITLGELLDDDYGAS
jgi:hypothetical protein